MVDEEAVEELSVVIAVNTELPCILIGKCPADVVMAADVVDPCCVVGQVVAVGQCLMEQVDFARGEGVPQQCHLQRVVADLAFVLADVLDNLVRMDDGFGFEEYGWRCDTHYGVKRANQGVCLRQVFATCAHLLPNKGNGIHAQNINTQVGKEHHFACHSAEYPRITVIQVPLEGIERCPYPAAVFQLRETTRMLIREDFTQGAVVLIGHPAVGEDVIEVVVERITGGAAFCPFVFVGCVVEDEIDNGGNTCFMQGSNDITQVVYRTQCRIDIAVAADRISAVAFAFGTFKQGHQVQIGQAQFLEIRDFGFQALQITCEQIDVAHAANLFVGQNPVRIIFARDIDIF